MRTSLSILICLTVLLSTKGQPIAVIYDVQTDSNITNKVIIDRVYNSIVSSVQSCGQMTVRQHFDPGSGIRRTVDAISLEDEVKRILIDMYIKKHTQTFENVLKIKEFSESIEAEIVVFPSLVWLGYKSEKEFELTLYIIRLSNLQFEYGPTSIKFSLSELDDSNLIHEKVCKWMKENPKSRIGIFIPDDGDAAPSGSDSITLDRIRIATRLLFRLSLLDPEDSNVQQTIRQFTSTEKGKKLFLHEKATCLVKLIASETQKETADRAKVLYWYQETITALKELLPLETNPAKRKKLHEIINDMQKEKDAITNSKPVSQ